MIINKKSNLVIGIYYHPEAFPPTLNAVSELSECFQNIFLVFRPHLNGTWRYPLNVSTVQAGKSISIEAQEQAPIRKKISFFLSFLRVLLRLCKRNKPEVILLYDYMALFAYSLIRPFLHFEHRIW